MSTTPHNTKAEYRPLMEPVQPQGDYVLIHSLPSSFPLDVHCSFQRSITSETHGRASLVMPMKWGRRSGVWRRSLWCMQPMALWASMFLLMQLTKDAKQVRYVPNSKSILFLVCLREILNHPTCQPGQAKWSSDKERRFAIVDKVSDTLIWQTLASLLVPPLIINRACKLTAFSLNKFFPLATTPSLTPRTRAAIQTAVGLSVIPFIVHPIDHAMHVTMDHTTRSLSSYIKNKYVVPAASTDNYPQLCLCRSTTKRSKLKENRVEIYIYIYIFITHTKKIKVGEPLIIWLYVMIYIYKYILECCD